MSSIKEKIKEFLESFDEHSFYVVIIEDSTGDVEHLYNACPVCIKDEIDRFIEDEGIEHIKDRGIH